MKAPKLPSFIRQNQHNTYTPRYRYYDPAKERREKREKLYGQKDSSSPEGEDATISTESTRDKFRHRVERVRHVKSSSGSSARTLVLIIFVLLALVWWMLNTDWFEGLVSSFINM